MAADVWREVGGVDAMRRPAKLREWAKRHPKLGKMPDKDLAHELGVSTNVISKARKELGIKNFVKAKEKTGRDMAMDHPDLGKRPDVEIGAEIGVSGIVVGRARQRLGIPPYRRKNGWYSKKEPPKNEISQLIAGWGR